MIACSNCNLQVPSNHKFCSNCGKNLGGVKSRLGSMKKRMEYNVRSKVNQVRETLDKQISEYLSQLEKNHELVVGGIKIPDKRKIGIRNALMSFQSKLDHESFTDEEFSVWMKDLQSRMDDEKCIVCFQRWVDTTTKVVVCKYCQSGGHQEHLSDWVRNNNFCPLCRHSLREAELISIDIK